MKKHRACCLILFFSCVVMIVGCFIAQIFFGKDTIHFNTRVCPQLQNSGGKIQSSTFSDDKTTNILSDTFSADEYIGKNAWKNAYTVVSQNYSQNDKHLIIYPVLSGLTDEVIQKKINLMLLENALYYTDNQVENTIEISFQIKRCDKILSVIYYGYVNYYTMPHPYNYFYTVNIDVSTGEAITPTNFFIPTKNELLQVLKATWVYPVAPEYTESVKKFLEGEIVNGLWDEADMDKPNSAINIYLTTNSLGVRFGIPYALGSYAIVEIPCD